MGLLTTMVNVVLPIFLIASIGFTARRALDIDPRPISRLSLYVLVPTLLFNSLFTSKIGGDEIARIGLFAVLLTAILVACGFTGSRLLGVSRSEASGLTLGLAFVNSANYGLPVALFAFGQEGFDRAAAFAAFSAVLTFSVAVFVAARGRLDWKRALIPVFQMPVLWAAVAAIALRATGLELPIPLQRAVTILSGGAIPAVILLLGMQVGGMRLQRIGVPVIATVVGRLGLSPLIALALVALIAPDPLTAKILILEAAMPTAVNVTLLAAELDAEADLVASITLITTGLSLLTVAGWVAYLQGL